MFRNIITHRAHTNTISFCTKKKQENDWMISPKQVKNDRLSKATSLLFSFLKFF